MPKTQAEKDTLHHFKEEYKDPEKAERIYYSLRNKDEGFDRSQGGGFKDKPKKKKSSKKAAWWLARLNHLPESYKSKLRSILIKSDRAPLYELTIKGMPIVIEFDAGDIKHTRTGRDLLIHYPSGFFKGSKGLDGDSVDCFVGPNTDANHVYLMRQINPSTKDIVEIKCMVGFPSDAVATEAYKLHYPDVQYFGGMRSFEINSFKSVLEKTVTDPNLLKSNG